MRRPLQGPGQNPLAPTEAPRLAGRLAFVTQQTFGGVGRAALKPVYTRAALASTADASNELDSGQLYSPYAVLN